MGSGQKAVQDDEDEWDDFQNRMGITSERWDVYSQEARWAKAGYKDYAFTGSLLVKYVNAEKEFNTAKLAYTNKLDLLKKVMQL